jgi:Tol biopolymer transport system component
LVRPNGRARQRAPTLGFLARASAIAFSPDGRRVVWTRIRRITGASTRSELLLTDLETRVTRRLRAEPGFYLVSAAAWAPDGTAIAFTRRDRLGSFEGGTYVTDPAVLSLRRVASDAGQAPAWSSDGKSLAYNIGISCKIRIVGVDSREGVTLPFEGCRPIWRPD